MIFINISANRLVQLIAGPSGVSMNTNLTFHRSGTGPAGRRAGRVPSLPTYAIHPPRQPAIPDEGRSEKKIARFLLASQILSSIAFTPNISRLLGEVICQSLLCGLSLPFCCIAGAPNRSSRSYSQASHSCQYYALLFILLR